MLCCGACYAQVTDEDVAAIEELGRQGGLFERLAASIAPEIFGMLDVKKVRGSRCDALTTSTPFSMSVQSSILQPLYVRGMNMCLHGSP